MGNKEHAKKPKSEYSPWLQPRGPQTGDGKTTRTIADVVKLVFKKSTDR